MSQKTHTTSSTADREIAGTRIFDAPRDLVFKMWTDPQHLAKWWGPTGFTTSTYAMELKPGGVWRFCMHGPDGTDYQNKITYVEVVEHQRLVYKHGGDQDSDPVNFDVTVTFEEQGGKTKVSMRMVFPTAALRDHVAQKYGAVEGMHQTLGRLEGLLAKTKTGDQPFLITRVFNAPRDVVWQAWTQRDRLMQWFGPKGFTMRTATLDLRPGGTFHYCLRSPEGKDLWGKFVYREITPTQRIVLVTSFSDENGGITRHPMSPTWPLEMLAITTFGEFEGKTTITIEWAPLNATDVERKTFDAARPSMHMGWGGTFDQLAQYLAKA